HKARFVGGRRISGFRQDLRTITNYLDRAVAFFGKRRVADIDYQDLRQFKRYVENIPARGKQRSVADVNHHLKVVRRMLNVAIEQGWIDTNPFSRGGPLIVGSFETHRTRILDPVEESRLLAACENTRRRHIIPFVIFAIETGCRRGEIQKLRWSDVNLEGRVIRIEAENAKTLRTRLVPITERLRLTLEALRRQRFRNSANV